jgi:hypothetical protein
MATPLFVGCSDDGSDDVGGEPVPTTSPFSELREQGVERYLGTYTPTGSMDIGDGVVSHAFRGEEGPICFTGNAFSMSTRDGSSDALMIFLQGGGACGPDNCDAVDQAPPGLPAFGILDAADASNPAADYDLGYVPYCDGSLFTGDRDVDSDGDGTTDRFFRGVKNLSAAIDVIVATYPTPSRILLTGNSAGGAGVHYALPLVRAVYPGVPIEVVNDSGVGILAPGVQEQLNDYWNAWAWFPESCADCIGEDGHLTGYHRYQLDEDANIRMAYLSTKQDERLVGDLGVDASAWEAALLSAAAELEDAHPGRFHSLIADGDGHTFILRDFDREVGGTTVRQWLTDMLTGAEGFGSVAD